MVLDMTDVQMLEVICVGVIIWFACVDWGIQDYCREDDDNLLAVMLFSVPVADTHNDMDDEYGMDPFLVRRKCERRNIICRKCLPDKNP